MSTIKDIKRNAHQRFKGHFLNEMRVSFKYSNSLRNTITKSVKTRRFSVSWKKEVFYEKGVLKNFVKYAGKHLCQGLFFNKVISFSPQLY